MDGWSGVDTPQTVMTTRAPAVLKTHFVGTVIIINWESVQDIGIIRKTWEQVQVSNPEPLWEIYHELWNRVSGLYAAIST